MKPDNYRNTRILLKLLLAAGLIVVLMFFSSTNVDFIYTGF